MNSPRIIGIDFGTHKTLVARWDHERQMPVLIRLRPASGDDMPTSVYVASDGQLLFGDEAEAAGASDPENLVRGFKRDVGTHAAPYLLHTHEFSPQDLTREYLRWLKALVESESLHGPVDHAVITVPAAWLAPARQELLEAAKAAGLSSVELLDEPVAAGIAFLRERKDLWKEGAILVFDWGAGTLDLAVLTLKDGQPQVLPDLVGGKATLGGQDIDRHLMQMVNKKLAGHEQMKLERRDPQERDQVLRKVTEWKIRHSTNQDAVWQIDKLEGVPRDVEIAWSSKEIRERVGEKLADAVKTCANIVERAQAQGVNPTGILLVGGSSQFPELRMMLEQQFPALSLFTWDQRISAVALGAVCHKAIEVELNTTNRPSSALLDLDPSEKTGLRSSLQVEASEPSQFPHARGCFVVGSRLIADISWCILSDYTKRELSPVYSFSSQLRLLDLGGRLVINEAWTDYAIPSEGMLAVKVENKWGFTSASGKTVIPFVWDKVDSFSEGLALVTTEGATRDCKYYINADGKPAFEVDYEFAGSFREGRACIGNRGFYGFIDCKGEQDISIRYDDTSYFSQGYAVVKSQNRFGFCGPQLQRQQWQLHCQHDLVWDDARSYSEGLAAVKKHDSWRFIQRDGRGDRSDKWELVSEYKHGLAAVKKDGKWGYIDKLGMPASGRIWEKAYSIKDGRGLVVRAGKSGFVDASCNEVIRPEWDYPKFGETGFRHDLAVVRKNGFCGLIDRDGSVVVPPEWDNIQIDSTDARNGSFIISDPGANHNSVRQRCIRLIKFRRDHKAYSNAIDYLEAASKNELKNPTAYVCVVNQQFKLIWEDELPVDVRVRKLDF